MTDERAVIAGSARTPLPGASRVGDGINAAARAVGLLGRVAQMNAAGKGWGACTGLGTPIGERIVQALGSA
jgi:hypothetical protein